jgi:hypothetical protein
MKKFKQGFRTIIFGGLVGSLLTYYNFLMLESNFVKKEIIIKNLRKNLEIEGLIDKVYNNDAVKYEHSTVLSSSDAVIIPFIYHTYKDYFLLSFSNFFIWLGKSDSKLYDFKQYILKKLN